MNPAVGPFAIAATLLVLAGVLKALRPRDTARALRAMGLRGGDRAVRLGAVLEVMLGLAALIVAGTAIAALVAVSYAAFGAFVTIALARRLPMSSCGCLGKVDTPPSRVHLGLALGACVAALAMAVDPSVSPVGVATDRFPASAAFVALTAAGVTLSFLLLTSVPRATPAFSSS